MKLYWAKTRNGYENWFVVAKNKKEAEEYHELAEGFGSGDATAKLICDISNNLIKKYKLEEANWPSHELIRELGGIIITESCPRRVNFNGKIYKEGTFTEEMFFDHITRTAGVYIINIQGTDKYKIGKTTNLKKRLKEFSTGNPENLKVVFFIEATDYASLEKHLHKTFKMERIGGEWFSLNDEKLAELKYHLAYLNTNAPDDFHVCDIKTVAIQGNTYN